MLENTVLSKGCGNFYIKEGPHPHEFAEVFKENFCPPLSF